MPHLAPFALAFALWPLLAAGALAQASVPTRFINPGPEGMRVVIVDLVCDIVVYEGLLASQTTIPITLCTDGERNAAAWVRDELGRERVYADLARDRTVELRFD